MSLIKTGRSPASYGSALSFPAKERKKEEEEEEGGTSVPEEQWHPMDQALFVLLLA